MNKKASATNRYPFSGNLDAANHVRGQSIYLDDIPEYAGTLHAKAFYSPAAHGCIRQLDTKAAEQLEGVIRIFTHRDIPGENQVGNIVPDEPLLAEQEVHYVGQPIALIVARSPEIAGQARELIEVDIEALPAITDPREAFRRGQLLAGSRRFRMGDVEAAFQKCKYIFEGTAHTGGQEHVYLEPQGAYAVPRENKIFIHSSTQGPTQVQRAAARVLGLSMNQVEVDVTRIGGGFGGKEDQASPWAALAALAAYLLRKPVKYILSRHEDLLMTGKRHSYDSDYRLGLDENLNILAYEATFYQNGGAAADLSPAVLERTLFHATNSYYVPNARLTAHCCKTNIAPSTAFRGFGGPQGMFVIEAAIHHAARELGLEPMEIQQQNLIVDGQAFPYGQVIQDSEARNCWMDNLNRNDIRGLRKEIRQYNAAHRLSKKGLHLMPVCFGISFTNTMMNHARALVHVYSDGSVGISTGAVEMGQGANTKMVQVAAREFGLRLEQVKIETTNTTRVANTSPSAASATSDLNGKALQDACGQIRERLFALLREELGLGEEKEIGLQRNAVWVDGEELDMTWPQLIQLAFSRRINLSAKGHYATPEIHFDKEKEKGHPFAYHVYGTAALLCTVDCLRGIYSFDAVHIVHDFGSSMNAGVDLGQVEGGLVQGMGWMTMENLQHSPEGQLLSQTLSNYKIPDIHSVPKEISVHFLGSDGSERAIYKSKTTGEPPLMYGIGAYFALYDAILAFNPEAPRLYHAPMTPERVLGLLYEG
ncbi:MAG: molybdopterin-dependent oxidoreductase [Lewinellaceae bacterium]|nr:molybdopterin-dependent oxidoreductase [Phaeodactylibacter sp.]MCB9035637.1 molybdopterin-dependent oxidoreductase [Lewinellaceae bacterium]